MADCWRGPCRTVLGESGVHWTAERLPPPGSGWPVRPMSWWVSQSMFGSTRSGNSDRLRRMRVERPETGRPGWGDGDVHREPVRGGHSGGRMGAFGIHRYVDRVGAERHRSRTGKCRAVRGPGRTGTNTVRGLAAVPRHSSATEPLLDVVGPWDPGDQPSGRRRPRGLPSDVRSAWSRRPLSTDLPVGAAQDRQDPRSVRIGMSPNHGRRDLGSRGSRISAAARYQHCSHPVRNCVQLNSALHPCLLVQR